ncbi:MAG: carboxypeptidase M32, partial [Planctomycetaceae bacterium]|nr:carboxypeptidase M32 [Planctomycetaceae bacterium]
MKSSDERYSELLSITQRAAMLASCGAVLSWDRETFMPPGGNEHRANQMSLIAGVTHEWATSPRIGELLEALSDTKFNTPDAEDRNANVREIRRAYRRATCLPQRLVEELAHVTALAQQNWAEARKEQDFRKFQPWLEKIVRLKREEAEAVGYADEGEPYDALLDEYEPDATSSQVAIAFDHLRQEIVPLLNAIQNSERTAPTEILHRNYNAIEQEHLAREAAQQIGFDFHCGRLDKTTHPFCSGFGPGDCRLTTRYDESFFSGAFFGTLHEAGHGMYEQGLPRDSFGTAIGSAVSLGIHESQSRLWENLVGRSLAFWQYFYPKTKSRFPDALNETTLSDFHFAINAVAPSFIRVEADEVTYNLHIMLRFQIERDLISGRLQPADVPSAWNDRFENDFGIRPSNDAEGCLQDVHWSAGLFGYFPTYALGNMYASQLFDSAGRTLGNLDDLFRQGDFVPLLDWLRQNV